MKKLILALAFVVLAPVSAQEQVDGYTVDVPIKCTASINPVLDLIKREYGEDMIFMGQSKSTNESTLYTSLWINPQTQTWSYIVVNKEVGHACIVGSGQGYQFMMPPSI